MKELLIVGAGGFVGTIFRYLLTTIPLKEQHVFPFKTFGINVAGCVLIGIIALIAQRHFSLSNNIILFLKTGICGGFTTFSTFALETSDILIKGHTFTALLYVTSSIIVGVGVILCIGRFCSV